MDGAFGHPHSGVNHFVMPPSSNLVIQTFFPTISSFCDSYQQESLRLADIEFSSEVEILSMIEVALKETRARYLCRSANDSS
jgi:hypothetical protein